MTAKTMTTTASPRPPKRRAIRQVMRKMNPLRVKSISISVRKYGIQVITKRYLVPGSKPVINVTHTIAVYLVDRHGDERAAFLPPLEPAQVAGDVRTLEGAGA